MSKEQLIGAIKLNDNEKVVDVLTKMNAEEVNVTLVNTLEVACQRKNNQAISLLIAKPGINHNVQDISGRTPLHVTSEWDNHAGVTQLLNCPGINQEISDKNGMTPFMIAAGGCKKTDALKAMLANPNTDVNVVNGNGSTALHFACVQDNHEGVSMLLAMPGINKNVRDKYGETPLMRATVYCNKEAMKVMLASPHAQLDIKDNEGRGLEEMVGREMSVGLRDWRRVDLEDRRKFWACMGMIQNERMNRKNRCESQKQTSNEERIEAGIEKIEKISQEIEESGQILKDNVDRKHLKMKNLHQRHSLEMEKLKRENDRVEKEMKRLEVEKERITLEKEMLSKKQRDEKSELEDLFSREYETNARHITSLKKIRKDLAQDIEKVTSGPSGNASNEDKARLEAARETLECPVCMEAMKPPTKIWACCNSHVVCEPCKNGLIRNYREVGGRGPHPPCPTCTSVKINQRAIFAEKMADSVFNRK